MLPALAIGLPEKPAQVLKPSLESWTLPLQAPLALCALRLAAAAARLKTMATGVLRETPVAPSAGVVLATASGAFTAGVAFTSAESAPSPAVFRAATAKR